MPLLDLPVERLREYRPASTAAADFDDFWKDSLAEAERAAQAPSFTKVASPLATVETYDVTFSGYRGQPVRAWLHLPRHREPEIPGVVQFMGYGTGRGTPVTVQNLLYSAAGYANLIVDNRGQAGSDTPDLDDSRPAHTSGFLTSGILDPTSFYYRRLITDAVRAISAITAHPDVDPTRIAVAGGSQGGALAVAAAALDPTPMALLSDLPFLSNFRRATDIASDGPYLELATFARTRPEFVDRIFDTLSYFDTMNFAARARVQARFSVALMDQVAPPSTVFAAYNHYSGPKALDVYQFNGHEGGGQLAARRRLAFLESVFASSVEPEHAKLDVNI